ncbi:conserved hypothetical protein [Candidatus Magnetomoraceae bacterium gMMP-15]
MDLYKDLSDGLTEEVLSDVANTFFSKRKELENNIETFKLFVKKLQKKERQVNVRANFLNYLFLDRKISCKFYKLININEPEILLKNENSDLNIPKKMPFAFTTGKEFTILVVQAYDALQQACDEYMNGNNNYNPYESNKQPDVNYKQIKLMNKIINEKIYKINYEASPVCVLQYVKQFDIETRGKKRITGATFGGYGCSIDEKLTYKPIDFNSLELKKYPRLPKHDEVVSDITLFCKKQYHNHKNEVKKLCSDLKAKIQIKHA